FKRINDTYGHLCGDEILREIAKVLKGSLRRKSDWAARYGGEEFLICFPGATTDVAYRIAEQMREDIQNRTYHFEGNELKVTISCGVSEMTGDDNLFEIISRADKLLYRAKQEGRNRVLYDNASQPQFMR
ncbi:MAG: GGDEF domain-containing protein, partial [Oscillospiraceae bacterium]|nr:GGDEF domain-containing protein [Oscillospiraceae bacterium]